MSQARLERLKQTYEALNSGDLEAATANMQPDFEFIPPPMLPEGGTYKGPEGVRQLWETWTATFPDFHIEIEETIDAGDKVIVMAAVCGTGTDSGMEVKTPSFAWVWSFEGDRAIRMEAMPNRATAMEAVGLSE